MNAKQAIALGIGALLAIVLVLLPTPHTPLRLVSSRTLPNGTINDTIQSNPIQWKPFAYVLVILATGYAVYRYRVSPA